MKKYTITVNGTAYEVEVEEMGGVAAPKAAAPKAAPAAAPAAAPKAAPAAAQAPVAKPGTISDVRISAGQTVGTGDVMIVM